VHGDDPAAVAVAFEAAGAPWIHVVDLDAALTGERANRDCIAAIASAVSVPVQVGGGVRSVEAASELADLGVTRVVVGTAAIEDPDLVAAIASRQRVAVGLDVRGTEVSVRGWTLGSGVDVFTALGWLESSGAEAVVVTQIKGEGLMEGPDVDGLAALLRATALDVVASGGVGSVDDLRRLQALEVDGRRLGGVIVGTAIYEGRIDVATAVQVLTAVEAG
jgi:phosphoribosylformimino-5-aminoimidazole carboxamide ribotide isomerase